MNTQSCYISPLIKLQHFSTYGEMIRRTTIYGPEEFNECVAKRIASKIVDLQTRLNRPVNISIAPGQTIIPIFGKLVEISTIDKSFLLDSSPNIKDYLSDIFKNPDEESLVFKDNETLSRLLKTMDPKISDQIKLFYEKISPYFVDWKNVKFFHMVELFEKPFFQYREIMKSWFFSKLPKCNSIPDSNIFSIDLKSFTLYPRIIAENGGIDIGVLGIGENCHIAFNEPGEKYDSSIAPIKLCKETIKHLQPIIPDIEKNPVALTLTTPYIINNFARIFVLASGKNKCQPIKDCLFDENASPASKNISDYPAFAIRFHPNTTILLDTEAASALREKDRRAIEEVQGDKKTAKLLLEHLDYKNKFSETEIKDMEKSIVYKYLSYTMSSKDLYPILKAFIESNMPFEDFEKFVENKIFDFYKKNAFGVLLKVDKTKKGKIIPFEKQKLEHVFRHILRVFRFPSVAHRIEERKKLLADMVLKDVIARVYLPTASEMRKNLAIETIFKHAIQHQNPSNYMIALETVFELIARQLKNGQTSVFFAFLPLIKKADDLHRVSRLLLELLIKAKNNEVRLFYKEDIYENSILTNKDFFEFSCQIVLMIASSSEKFCDAFINYFSAALTEYTSEKLLINEMLDKIHKIKKLHIFIQGINIDIADRTKIVFNLFEYFKDKDVFDDLKS